MLPIHNQQGECFDVIFHEGHRENRLVIMGHGVTGNKDCPMLIAVAEALAKKGWPCLRFSFSGNGESEGEFTDSNISKEITDLTAILDQLGTGKKIAYIGHSMGGAVGTLTAARDDRIKVMISLAGMVYTEDFLQREFGEITADQDLMWDELDCPFSSVFFEDLHNINNTLDAVQELRLPWLLIHGMDDDVVFPKDSRDLREQLRGPSELIEITGADHLFEDHYPILINVIDDWLQKHL